MALYSRTEGDANQDALLQSTTVTNSVDKYDSVNNLSYDGDSTVAGAGGYTTVARRVVFIDDIEATLEENKSRGLTAPGWWEYMTFTDGSGKTRHKAQHLCSMKDAPPNPADLDDNIAADVPAVITLVQPVNATADESNPGVTDVASFTVAGSSVAPAGVLTFQWQRKPAGGRWTNIAGETTDTLNLTNLTVADNDQDQYRVKVNSDNGAAEAVSDAATLTVTLVP